MVRPGIIANKSLRDSSVKFALFKKSKHFPEYSRNNLKEIVVRKKDIL